MHHHEGRELRRLLVRALVLEQAAAYNVLGGVAIAEREATAARADQLVAVPDGEDRFVLQFGGERNRARKQIGVAARPTRASERQTRTNTAQTTPSLNPVRTLILSNLSASTARRCGPSGTRYSNCV